jgi:hypothetical protein
MAVPAVSADRRLSLILDDEALDAAPLSSPTQTELPSPRKRPARGEGTCGVASSQGDDGNRSQLQLRAGPLRA